MPSRLLPLPACVPRRLPARRAPHVDVDVNGAAAAGVGRRGVPTGSLKAGSTPGARSEPPRDRISLARARREPKIPPNLLYLLGREPRAAKRGGPTHT